MVDEKEAEAEAFRENLIAKSEISLLIKNYNDIFSSFDPRPYSEKPLSDDFLQEVKRAARDKKGVYELRFLVPRAQRNFEHETMIKKRLREHFRKHLHMLEAEVRADKKRGYLMALIGTLMIFTATYISSYLHDSFLMRLMFVLLEPGGWFTAWTGLEQAFYLIREKKPDYEFYKKMTDSEIRFSSY